MSALTKLAWARTGERLVFGAYSIESINQSASGKTTLWGVYKYGAPVMATSKRRGRRLRIWPVAFPTQKAAKEFVARRIAREVASP